MSHYYYNSTKIIGNELSIISQIFYSPPTIGMKYIRMQLALNISISSTEINSTELSSLLRIFYSYFLAFGVENDIRPRQVCG